MVLSLQSLASRAQLNMLKTVHSTTTATQSTYVVCLQLSQINLAACQSPVRQDLTQLASTPGLASSFTELREPLQHGLACNYTPLSQG